MKDNKMEEKIIKDRGLNSATVQFDDGDVYIRQFDECILLSTLEVKYLIQTLTEFVALSSAQPVKEGENVIETFGVKKVKLCNGGGNFAHVDYEDGAVTFSNYNVYDKVDQLSFIDIQKIQEAITPPASKEVKSAEEVLSEYNPNNSAYVHVDDAIGAINDFHAQFTNSNMVEVIPQLNKIFNEAKEGDDIGVLAYNLGVKNAIDKSVALLELYRIQSMKSKSHSGDFAENLFYQAIEEIQDISPKSETFK